MPIDASQMISGIVAIACGPGPASKAPNMTAMPDRHTSGSPTSPNSASRRGISPDVYMREPRIRPLPTPTTKPGPSRNVASWTATSDWPRATSVSSDAPAGSWQRHDRQHAHDPDRDEPALDEASGDVAEGKALVVTLEQCERDDGGTDVGEDEDQLQERADEDPRVAAAGAEDEVGVVEQRVVQQHRRDARDEGENPQQARDPSELAWCGKPLLR